MKYLHTVTALIEVPTGLGLIAVPTVVVRLLLGAEISGASIPLGRVAGVALLALGIACWLTRGEQGCAARGMVAAMVIYNLGAVAVFVFAGLGSGLRGIALWPATILHAVMTIWCIACLLRKPSNPATESSPPASTE